MIGENEASPLLTGRGLERVAEGAWLLHGQGQSFVARSSAGLVLVDAGPGGGLTRRMIATLREALPDESLHAIVYSHGHLGYNSGVAQWMDDAQQRGQPRPRLIAQRLLQRRYARYRDTMPLQQALAELQFRHAPGAMAGKLPLTEPDEWFDEQLLIGDGQGQVQLLWAPSETEDALAVWLPATRTLYGGAALIDSMPNVGTPLRTLRDPVRWAQTLERLAALQPERAVREFGPTLVGAEQVAQVLGHTARALRWLRDEAVRLMNSGCNEAELLAQMRYPEALFSPPWMRPTYGDPSYVVRDIWRAENGWWDRNPTSLHPEAPAAVAQALGEAIADKAQVIACAQAHAQAGRLQLALHVIDLLATASGDAPELAQARALKAGWLRARAAEIGSYVSKSLYHASADAIANGQPRLGIR